jgi:hypothetical protein
MWTARGLRAALFGVAAAVMSVGTLGGGAGAASAGPCQPSATQLISAMSAQIPSTSALWPEIQSAFGHGGPNGSSIDAVLSVLNRNNYTYDCGTNQLRDTSATPRPSPAAAAGSSTADPTTTVPSAAAPGAAAAGSTASTAAGSPGQAGSDATVGGNTAAAAGANAASSQPATGGGGGGGGDTLPIVIALVLSTVLVVFVAVRHFRKAA